MAFGEGLSESILHSRLVVCGSLFNLQTITRVAVWLLGTIEHLKVISHDYVQQETYITY